MRRVYVLGSGFSKAIHSGMPVLSDLLKPINDKLTSPWAPRLGPEYFSHDVERWLSFLASPPPWLDRAESLRNQASFLDASEVIAEAVSTAALKALVEEMPLWLGQLVRYWRETRETVLTFNYDTFVEHAYMHTASEDGPNSRGGNAVDLYVLPLTSLQSRGGGTLPPGRTPSFKLLKLHGSTSWYYSGAGAGPNDEIIDSGLYARRWPDSSLSQSDPDLEMLTADKTPLIIPPVAVKTSFYENSALRVQWHEAARALASADEIVLMGFSVPQTDLLVRDLLATNIRSDALVTVVDRNEELPVHIAKVLGGEAGRVIGTFAGAGDPVQRWVSQFANTGD